MALLLRDRVPDFKAETTTGPISFHDWICDDWAFFFSHPADFKPVCTTKMGRTARLADEFAVRRGKPTGLIANTFDEHRKWIENINETQNKTLRFPIVATPDLEIAKLYGMIHPREPQTAAVSSVSIFAPERKLRLSITYPMSVVRKFDEIPCVIDELQKGDAKDVAFPADRVPRQRAIIPPSVANAEAEKKFPQGFEEIRPYLSIAHDHVV